MKDYDVILLSETWLETNDSIYLRGFDVVRKERDNRIGGGVLIFTNNRIKYGLADNLFDCNGNIGLCGIKLFISNEKTLIVSCYRPPDVRIDHNSWERFLCQFRGRFLVAGNFNAHHTL